MIEMQEATIKSKVDSLKKDEELISKKTSLLAILYQRKCLVDRSKSDAVQIYLSYQIDQATVENRKTDAEELKKELNKKDHKRL